MFILTIGVSKESDKLVITDSITLNVNGRRYKFSVGDGVGDVSPSETLLDTLRKRLQLTGSKKSCGAGACGCCALIVNGDAIAACMILTIEMDGCLAMKDNGYKNQEVKALIKRMVAAM